MYFFGHVGITMLLATMFSLSILFVLIGVWLPDIIDKSLFFIGLAPCARFIGHTVFVGPIVGLITYGITRKKSYAIAITFGVFAHLFEDINGFILPWFYPLVSYNFNCPPTYEIIFSPYIITMEIIGLILLVVTIKFRKELREFGRKIFKFMI